MHKIFALLLAVVFIFPANAQHKFITIIKDSETRKSLPGVSIHFKSANINSITDSAGFAEIVNINAGISVIVFSMSGYKTITRKFTFPVTITGIVEIMMEKDHSELDEVIVQSTRTSRSISNTATRVETIDGEELDEKNNMRPANISMLLHESTGLQVQQTSATSGNASIRVQGLDGRYTQLLKDGYPNFGNFASGLSILEIPPLDLRQVEVIKGPASTLYGAGAIAGVVNFISKTPGEKFSGDFILNQSNIGQTNIGGYISKKKGKFGYAVLAAFNAQKAYDVDKDDFTEIPKGQNFTIHPRLYFYLNPSSTLMIGNSLTKGNIYGGDIQVIKGNGNASHSYFEKNITLRNTSTLEFEKKWENKSSIKLKQSVGFFNREISIPGYSFAGLNTNSFTDLSYIFLKPKHTAIFGLNVIFDQFKQKDTAIQNTESLTSGIYIQDTWDLTDKVKIESGLRIDHVQYENINYKKSKAFVLPRLSVLFKLSNKLSSRIGAGMGYKMPTIFTEQTESIQYRNVSALNNVTPEKSFGGTADINFKTSVLEDLSFSINQLFFYTRINTPLVLETGLTGEMYFVNAIKPIISNGFETNVKFIYKENLKLFAGYTYTIAKATYLTGNQFVTLLPKNKVNLTLMYEKEDNFKLGLEGYFNDIQYLSNGTSTVSFWEFGFMAQKTFRKFSCYVNFENFTDQRQSRYKTVVSGPHNNPVFDEIWNHTEGFVWNAGVKLKF